MPRLFRRAVRRRAEGSFEVRLSGDEREGLRALFAELAETMAAQEDHPDLRALFPPTYGEDPERETAYRELVGDDLRDSRLASLATARHVVDATTITEEELIASMQALNALRLVLASRLDITGDETGIAAEDPRAAGLRLYDYLGMLLAELVDAVEE